MSLIVKFSVRAYKKPIATNHNAIFCDMCDKWVHLHCNNICIKTCRDLKKDPNQSYCKLCTRKEIPFSKKENAEFSHTSNERNTMQKNQINEPTTLFEKLYLFSDNEDMDCKYSTIGWFKENGLDENNKNMSLLP